MGNHSLHEKKCGRCEKIKPISEFRLVESQCKGIAGYCFTCEKEYNKERYQRTREKQIKSSKAYYHQNKEACRTRNNKNRKKIEQKLRKNIIKKAKAAKLKPPYSSLLGCSSKELSDHISSLLTYPMALDNYGKVWQLIKIRPVEDFPNPRDAFHYTNFAPTLHANKPRKTCKKCNIERPATEFVKNYDGEIIRDTCKTCMYHEREKQSPEEARKKRRAYITKRKVDDLGFKLRVQMRKRITKLISGSIKSYSTTVGCSKEKLKAHIESQWKEGMNWENYGTYWVIDHIKPLAAFNLDDPKEIKKCCHYTNLQPLTIEENLSKGAIYKGVDYSKKKNKR